MSRSIKVNEHRAVIDQALKEAYEAVEEANTLLHQPDHDVTKLTAAVKSVEWRLDRVEAAITLMHGDVIELGNVVQELHHQRNEAAKLLRTVLSNLMYSSDSTLL